MLLAVGLVIAERKSGGGHTEYNCAGAVCDKVCGGVWGWGPIGPPRFPCIRKCENDDCGNDIESEARQDCGTAT